MNSLVGDGVLPGKNPDVSTLFDPPQFTDGIKSCEWDYFSRHNEACGNERRHCFEMSVPLLILFVITTG